MAKKDKKQPEMVVASQMLLCTLGTFFVFTKKGVSVEVLSDTETKRLWEKLTIAEGCVFMDTQHAREQVLRQIFGHDAVDFIPATSRECLMFYVEHYEGVYSKLLKGLCACILTGTPFGPHSANPGFDEGGYKVHAPVSPKPNTGPSGETFEPSLSEISAEMEIRAIEGSHR